MAMQRGGRWMRLAALGLCVAAVAGTGLGRGDPPGAGAGGGGADAAPAAGAPSEGTTIRTAEDLLGALETADRGISTLRSAVRYMRDYGPLEPTRDEWSGTLWFRARPGADGSPARRAFAVEFNKRYTNGQVRDEQMAYIFDGEWLVEKDSTKKQMVRRRMVPPGKVADPLRLGEGPFPLPIGQKRSEILSRFTAELRPPEQGFTDEERQPWMALTWCLRLVPREGTEEAREYEEVRIWYQKSDLLPRLARTVNTDGGRTEVLLTGAIATNVEIPDGVFDTGAPPAGAGWDVDTREYRGPADKAP
jgi:hypothetical protein